MCMPYLLLALSTFFIVKKKWSKKQCLKKKQNVNLKVKFQKIAWKSLIFKIKNILPKKSSD